MSAAFKNAKKKVSQLELRKLMNEQKGLMKSKVKKIDSPLAKYTEAGQLMCLLCKSIVRSEAVWPVHINAKQHKENIALAKRLKEQPPKRPISPTSNDSEPKKLKSILKNKPNDTAVEESRTAPVILESKLNLGLNKKEEPMEVEKEEVLPEGFFDDPKKDAKARNLEYKDPIEEEWDKFQKEMKEVESTSAAIIAEDQEEATTERQIGEIDEQLRNWARVLDLERKKEAFQKQAQAEAARAIEQDESMDEDSDFDEYLDWRAKTSFK